MSAASPFDDCREILPRLSGYTREHAYTFIRIATVLKSYKTRLIQARVRDNVMEKLAASPEHVGSLPNLKLDGA